MTNFYTLDGPKSPWGDYSHILIAGMSEHLNGDGGLLQLWRAGPYVPPISFPGIQDIVVTETFRKDLEASGLAGIRFQPVIKKHIVNLDWHLWDKSRNKPPEYPKDGEPEGYLLDRPHCPETSEQVGDLWEVVLEVSAKIYRDPHRPFPPHLVKSSVRGGDLFRAEDVGYNYVTEKAKKWFEQHAAEHIRFKEVKTT